MKLIKQRCKIKQGSDYMKYKRIENYLIDEINQRKSYSKKFSKYVTAFDYIEKILIVLSATTAGICIISHATVVGAPVNCWLYYIIFLSNRNSKGIIKNNIKQKEKA